MTNGEYKKYTAAELRGRKVRALVDIRSHVADVPAGTILTVLGKRGGLDLEMDRCERCQVAFHVHGVDPYNVELLPFDATWEIKSYMEGK